MLLFNSFSSMAIAAVPVVIRERISVLQVQTFDIVAPTYLKLDPSSCGTPAM